MSEGAGIELYSRDGQLKEQAVVQPPAGAPANEGTVSIQLFAGHPDDGELKEEAQIP